MSDSDLIRDLATALEAGESVVLATVVKTRGSTPRKAGAKMLVATDGSRSGTICGGCVEAEVYAEAMELFENPKPQLLSFTLNDNEAADYGLRCGGQMEVYIEMMTPNKKLYLIGAGHISEALARIARTLEMDIHILDDNAAFLNAERFPDCELHECSLEDTGSIVKEGRHVAAVIATRGHKQDSIAFLQLINRDMGYLGLVTSQKRVMEFYRKLLDEGSDIEDLKQIAAPTGLDICAETPEEIAVSISAEIISAFKGGDNIPMSQLFWQTAAAKKLKGLSS